MRSWSGENFAMVLTPFKSLEVCVTAVKSLQTYDLIGLVFLLLAIPPIEC
jgi:hypothetical protein